MTWCVVRDKHGTKCFVRLVRGVSVYVRGSVIMVLRRRGDLMLGMGVGVCVRKRKLTLQVARVISSDGGRMKARIVFDDSLRCLNGMNMDACLDSVCVGGAEGGKRVYIGNGLGWSRNIISPPTNASVVSDSSSHD